MHMITDTIKYADASDSTYPYSRDLEGIDSHTQKLHPVYVIGMNREFVHSMRNTYVPVPELRVGIYGIYDTSCLGSRIGISPSVVVLGPEVRCTGSLAGFIRKSKAPVLRLQHVRTSVSELPRSDYYGGVYDTLDIESCRDSVVLSRTIVLGILTWSRYHEVIPMDKHVPSAKRKFVMPQPESSFGAFAAKQIAEITGISLPEKSRDVESFFSFQ